MDINIEGNPGTGNTFQEIHIDNVQNFNPNATTVINYNYGEKQKPAAVPQPSMQEAERELHKAEIMEYVGRIRQYVSKEWKNRYDTLWRNILALPEVEAEVYDTGKQRGTTFNRNLIANIIYIMCDADVIQKETISQLTVALEGDKDHSVRGTLGSKPDNSDIVNKVYALIQQ